MKNLFLRTVGVSALIMPLNACGGGDGAKPMPAPPPLPTPPTPPPPPPPPPPPSSGFDTQEYKNSTGAAQAYAIYGYEKGATGKGITAAIIDTGIALNSPEFTGRIHAASANVAGPGGPADDFNHGTMVASVLGAAKDGAGMHGVAFEATLLAIKTNVPGSCPTCQFVSADVAEAIDLAVQNNARVINMSFGQKSVPWAPNVVEAMNRATEAGVVIIIAAGNYGEAQPVASTLIATQPEARETIIVAGAANSTGTGLFSTSNRAGSAANFYLAAPGENLTNLTKDGTLVTASGTSGAAPVISGAVALLAQAFPNLTGKQIVNLLLTTATDIDAPGTDIVSGRGVLNIANAFAPQGKTSMAGSMAPVSLASNGVLSPAMGDAKGELKGAVFLDSYARAYEMDPGRTLSRAGQDAPLHAAFGGSYGTDSAALGPIAVSVTTSRSPPHALLQQMELSLEQARAAKAIVATAVSRLSIKTSVALGLSESGRALQQRLSQHQGSAFLVAVDPIAGNGSLLRPGSSIGIRHDLGALALTMTSEGGEIRDSRPTRHFGRSAYRTTALIVDRRLGRMRFSFGASLLDEEETVLGGRFSSAFSSAGSSSWFADGAASLDLDRGWGVYASYRHGWTSIGGSDALVEGGRLTSNAFAFDLAKTGIFRGGDKVAVRVMQPLRVRTGGFEINLPVSYDYASGEVGYQHRFFNLAPTGRELNYEISYGMRAMGGNLAANAFLRTEPGHIEWMKNDIGGALRFTLGF